MDAQQFWVGLSVNGDFKEKVWQISSKKVEKNSGILATSPLLFKAFIQCLIDQAADRIPNIFTLDNRQLAGLLNQTLREPDWPEAVRRAIVMVERGPDHPHYVPS